ncbi:hypothetical protein [Marinobacterium weihaiense]|uniref:Uncharacterized protein n=1 Tax=Marinobacterium weihaiense TaxID=2851016 RepID=A0ABS6MBM3_9GAMM|nr:hypothetical protein [Marinobacterium weihaiense]MBV0933570.1 hypothetical protein [Marinobacterium weihaiense]
MRNLSILATPWRDVSPPGPVELPDGDRLESLSQCDYDGWHYQRLTLYRQDERFVYLYAMFAGRVWVLGVFDTPDQADLFLALHNANPLNVPALEQTDQAGEAVFIDQGRLVYPLYQGLYRVGFKSYQVEIDSKNVCLRAMLYVDRYNSQGLGVLPEKEACLAIYSHFDGRLRGCKMC